MPPQPKQPNNVPYTRLAVTEVEDYDLSVTNLLKKAFDEAEQILSPEEQDRLARSLLDFVQDERKWEAAFSNPKSHTLLERLAAEALEEERTGKTDKLDPNDL